MSQEKQIEGLATEIYSLFRSDTMSRALARRLYGKGWRKQSEGEWIVTNNNGFWHYDCPFCDDGYAQETKLPVSNYCANCGAKLSEPKMKGGE